MIKALQVGNAFRKASVRARQLPSVDLDTNDASWILPAVNFLESCMHESVLILCKVNHLTIQHVSRNAEHLLGYSSDYLKRLSPEEYFDLVHPDDQLAVKRFYEKMELHSKSEGYQPEVWRFDFHYRLRMTNGTYEMIQNSKMAFLHSSNRYIYYSLMRILPKGERFNAPYFVLNKKVNSSFRSVNVYVPPTEQVDVPTHRELEVLKCLDACMTTEEIANTLSVSISTIKNHKTNLFRKLTAHTTLHALNNARKMNWI
jgi:DNA-binding CsgD family transcriptional regulator